MIFQGVFFFFSMASRINFVKCLFKSFICFLIIGCLFFFFLLICRRSVFALDVSSGYMLSLWFAFLLSWLMVCVYVFSERTLCLPQSHVNFLPSCLLGICCLIFHTQNSHCPMDRYMRVVWGRDPDSFSLYFAAQETQPFWKAILPHLQGSVSFILRQVTRSVSWAYVFICVPTTQFLSCCSITINVDIGYCSPLHCSSVRSSCYSWCFSFPYTL